MRLSPFFKEDEVNWSEEAEFAKSPWHSPLNLLISNRPCKLPTLSCRNDFYDRCIVKQQFLQLVLKRGNAATLQRLFLTIARLSSQQRLLQWRNGKESKNKEIEENRERPGDDGNGLPLSPFPSLPERRKRPLRRRIARQYARDIA